jgi:hypothetical protein
MTPGSDENASARLRTLMTQARRCGEASISAKCQETSENYVFGRFLLRLVDPCASVLRNRYCSHCGSWSYYGYGTTYKVVREPQSTLPSARVPCSRAPLAILHQSQICRAAEMGR